MITRFSVARADSVGIDVSGYDFDWDDWFPSEWVPPGLKEGDIISMEIAFDTDETRRLRDETRRLQDELGERDPGGDIKL